MPPRYGWTLFQTPNDPVLIFWPIPNSSKSKGIPSSNIMIRKGITNAPANIETKIDYIAVFCKHLDRNTNSNIKRSQKRIFFFHPRNELAIIVCRKCLLHHCILQITLEMFLKWKWTWSPLTTFKIPNLFLAFFSCDRLW